MMRKVIILTIILLIISCIGIYLLLLERKNEVLNNYQINSNTIFDKGCEAYSKDKSFVATSIYRGNDNEFSRSPSGYSELVIKNMETNSEIAVSKVPNRSCAFLWIGSNIYIRIPGYESMGKLMIVNINNKVLKDLSINDFGHLSLNSAYYAYTGNTAAFDGTLYCPNSALNSIKDSSSAIRLLDLNLALSNTLIEDKNKIFNINGWSDDSSSLYFDEMIINPELESECPELVKVGSYKINIHTKQIQNIEI